MIQFFLLNYRTSGNASALSLMCIASLSFDEHKISFTLVSSSSSFFDDDIH